MIFHRVRFVLQAAVLGWGSALATVAAEDYAITSVAGAANVTTGADGTPGSFNNPYGVAIDADRNLYVADTVNNTIRKITPGRVVTTIAGAAGQFGTNDGTGTAARFNFPVGIVVDRTGNIFVADTKNSTIRKITPAGVVSTFAGAALQFGAVDGTGAAARFFLPFGLAIDSAGNLYVADSGNHLIRKITPDGVVSTLAGAASQAGFQNGPASGARFSIPMGVAVDGSGNVYVADSANNAIRRITAAGVVTTIAGTSGIGGAQDGAGTSARFNQPRGVAVDSGGNLFVADYGNNNIRHITTNGTVSTIAGSTFGLAGETNSVGTAARFYEPVGIIVDGNVIYVADSSNNQIRRGQPASTASLPVITVQPLDQEVTAGQAVSFAVSVTGSGLTFQWLRDTLPISGATGATYTLASPQQSDTGTYSVRVSGPGGSVDSGPGTLSVFPVGTGPVVITARPLSQNAAIGQSVTFSVTASGSGLSYQWLKNGGVISGATGPTLTIASAQPGDAATYTVRVMSGSVFESAIARLTVAGSAGASVSINTQPSSQNATVGQSVTFSVNASGPSGLTYQWLKNDVLIGGATTATYTIPSVQFGDAGNYAVRVSGAGQNMLSTVAVLTIGSSGPTSWLSNLSILTDIASAGDAFTMGFVVGGAGTTGTKPILIRAAGPSLAQLGVQGALADPRMEFFAGPNRTGENDNWGGTATLSSAFSAVGAFAYITPASLDAAAFANIPAGDNSVRVLATGAGTGTVIAELYDSTPVTAFTNATPRLINVSVLKHIGSGLTAGFVIGGTTAQQVLIRAVGPTIGGAPFNVGGVVDDPQLTLFSGQNVIGTNDNWGGTAELTAAFGRVGAFALPAGSRDAAILVTLQPGPYTVRVSGVGNSTGVAIVEVYEVR